MSLNASQPYHSYVFRDGGLVGDFEGMYSAEETEGFDSWRANDLRHLRVKLSLQSLEGYNFARVIDLGCGKGTVTQFLKKKNNWVLGVDTSTTAIEKANTSFPDIRFVQMDVRDVAGLKGSTPELVTVQAVLAYIPEWRELLSDIAGITEHCLIAEYIPPNPCGMVKSCAELVSAFSEHFTIKHKIILDDEVCILFGKART